MRNKKIQFANLVCRSGDKTLLDLFDSIIYPAFFGEALQRTYGSTTYIFHGVKLENLNNSRDGSGLAIVGRIVKDEYLRVEQILADGELEEVNETHRRSPSSIFVVFLKNHRMAYVRENPGAPSLHVFGVTLESFVKQIHKTIVSQHAKNVRAEFPRGEWVQRQQDFLESFPVPTVDVVQLTDARDIREKILGMGSVNSLSFDVIRKNDEINPGNLFDSFREEKVRLGNPAKASIKFSDPDDTMKVDEAASLVEQAAEDQNVVYSLEGKIGDQTVKYSNASTDENDDDMMAVTVPLDNELQTPLHIAQQANVEFDNMVQSGRITEPQMQDAQQRIFPILAGIIAKFFG